MCATSALTVGLKIQLDIRGYAKGIPFKPLPSRFGTDCTSTPIQKQIFCSFEIESPIQFR